MSASDVVLSGRGLGKTYPGVRALDGVDLDCRAGRVHALLGENGAGKSTLVRVLTGNVAPDAGEIRLDGEPVRFADPRQALRRGVTAVHQELTVLPAMSVLDNVMLGHERARRGMIDRAAQRDAARAALDRVGLDVDPRTPVESLSLANQQLVEIARALTRETRLLILDEPSAVLSGDKLASLFEAVRTLAADGVAVVYISHRLEEVAELADDVTVLRDGSTVSTGPADEYDVARIIREMVGRDVDTVFPALRPPGEQVLLSARGLRLGDGTAPVDLDVRAGEVVSVGGLVGSGRSRLLRAVAGAAGRGGGTVEVDGRRVGASVRAGIRAGVVLVPEERKTEGLVLDLPVRANATLASIGSVTRAGWLSPRRERAAFDGERDRWGIRASSGDQATSSLSGGNQQKVVLAKWLRTRPRVLLLDEPTRGVDVGAKAEIYELIAALAADGIAVLVVSSDLPEVIGIAHRVLVCRAGTVVEELRDADITEHRVMRAAVGAQEVAS